MLVGKSGLRAHFFSFLLQLTSDIYETEQLPNVRAGGVPSHLI